MESKKIDQLIEKTKHNDLIVPLLTDNYQITMAYAYFLHNRQNEPAVFEAFFRTCPFKGQVINKLIN